MIIHIYFSNFLVSPLNCSNNDNDDLHFVQMTVQIVMKELTGESYTAFQKLEQLRLSRAF